MNDLALPEVTTVAELESALAAPRVFVVKHSPICGVSFRAMDEVERFRHEHPDVPIVLIDVIASRPLSQEVAARTGIRHESPQVLWFVKGRAVAHASHGRVTAAMMRAMLEGTPVA